MTEKELLLLAIADLENKCLFLKREIPKLATEIRSLNEEVDFLKKTGGLICSHRTGRRISKVESLQIS